MRIQLQDLRPGEAGRVTGFTKENRDYRQRLLAMGLLPGVIFTVTRVAPLGDPVEIRLRNFPLTLRKHEADILHVEKVTP